VIQQRINVAELEDDPRKLAQALTGEMVELANAVRGLTSITDIVQIRLEHCLLLSGLAAGIILRDQRHDTEAELASIHQIVDYAATHGVSKFDLIEALRGDSEQAWVSFALGESQKG
jgi:hypothetical protein